MTFSDILRILQHCSDNETVQILQLTAEIYAAYQQTVYIAIHEESLQTLYI